jgi:predicted  nucleic acid-binding Zn-ribbon protein
MNTVAKILIVVNLVLAGAFLASAGNFLGQMDHWKNKYEVTTADLQDQIDQRQIVIDQKIKENATLTQQSVSLQTQCEAALKEASEVRGQNDLLKEAHNQASTQLTQATAALEKAQDTIKSNQQLIDALQGERATNSEALRVAQDAKEAAIRSLGEKEQQFENLMAQKQALEAQLEDTKHQLRSAQLTAETAVSKAGGSGDVPMDQPAHDGQILAVDGSANVAIISLGAEDGVRPGYRYTVSRGSQYIGMIEITDVQAKQSAGRSIKSLQKVDLQRGDRVMSR